MALLWREYARLLDLEDEYAVLEAELAALPGVYAPPLGGMLIATLSGEPAGCIAWRRFAEAQCELKHLFVSERARSRGIGQKLMAQALECMRGQGAARACLDSLERLESAGRLYKAFGFQRVARFNDSPEHDIYYMALDLTPKQNEAAA